MTNSVAVVTGASQGIGRSIAVRLARDFKSIVLVAGNRTKLEEAAAAVAAGDATPLVIDLDLSKQSSAKAVVARALATFGRIDAVLFKNSDILTLRLVGRSSASRRGETGDQCTWIVSAGRVPG
jgi:NAD(P)-dependent dehydrogenase (short-subunit alcohol dehydrogenase family)